jgi:uncharacterized repeat protein (TIGR02543 family)
MKRRDSVNKKLLCVGAICFLISLFTACELPGPGPGSDGKVVVRIQIGNGILGRTVMPDDIAPLGIDKWELWGGKGANTDPLLTFDVVADAAVALEPGEWHFTIKGYKGDDHILSGSIAKQTISLEETQTLVFEVEPVENVGNGIVSITIKLPAGSGVTEAQVFKDGTKLISSKDETELETSPTTLTVSDSEIVFKDEAFPAGEWYLSFRLYKGDKLLGVVSEIVHVWADLTSSKTYTLLQKDLNLVYTIKYHVWDEVAREWNDTYKVDDGQYQIAATATLAEPSPRPGYTFKGWYANKNFSGNAVTKIPVGSGTGDRDFYSKWIKTFSDCLLADALDEIMSGQDEEYIILLKENETLGPQPALNVTGGKELAITLKGDGQTTISLDPNGNNGSLFTLGAESGSSLTLVLEDITLEGKDGNNAPVVKVNSGATLDIQDGSSLTGNTSSASGGGVSVAYGGAVTMSGGKISGNTVSGSYGNGGGVYINGGTFTMTGGAISDNKTPGSTGGGQSGGGGVFITNGGTLSMSGGAISDNSAYTDGGGVFIYSGTFEMSGGEVSGNKTQYAGGVYVGNGTFTMSDGVISGNSASVRGGGVFVNIGTFTMSGGVIYGSEEEAGKKNTAGTGAAIYRKDSASPNTTNSTIDMRQVTP